jgi:hypothetical protein
MTTGLSPAAQSIWSMYQAQLQNTLSSMNTQIVMPVGVYNSLEYEANIVTGR